MNAVAKLNPERAQQHARWLKSKQNMLEAAAKHRLKKEAEALAQEAAKPLVARCRRKIVMRTRARDIRMFLAVNDRGMRITGYWGESAIGMSARSPVREIIEETAKHFGVTAADIVAPGRLAAIVIARQVAMWRVRRERKNMSLPEIGRRIGGRDHTTVMHAVRKIDGMIARGEIVLPAAWGSAYA